MKKPESYRPPDRISGMPDLREIADVLEEGAKETTKCCATGTCDDDDDDD